MTRTFESYDELKAALAALPPEEALIPAVLLTPALATDIIAHDPVNRKVRAGNLAHLEREIVGGHWNPLKSSPIRFLPTFRMNDGQHRCRTVIKTGIPIVVSMCIVPDTIGVDEGAGRTIVDHLQLSHGLDEERATLAAVVTKALCEMPNASNRDFLATYQQHEVFIRECVDNVIRWLEDQQPSIEAVFKPAILVVLRARAIQKYNEPAESVDQFLVDAINGGATAKEGTPRRALAKQFFDSMQEAFTNRKKTKRSAILEWLLAALQAERAGIIRNIATARRPGAKKRRRMNRRSENIRLVELVDAAADVARQTILENPPAGA